MKNSIKGMKLNYSKVSDFRQIRKENYPYLFIWIMYYSWVIVFTTWWAIEPQTGMVYSIQQRNIIHMVTLISSAIFIMFLRKESFVLTSRIGAVFLVCSMLLYITSDNGPVILASSLILGISIGIINISILMPYIFVLNNTEKFYAAIAANVLINLFSIVINAITGNEYNYGYRIFSLAILFISLIPVAFFRVDSIKVVKPRKDIEPCMPSPVYLSIILNSAFIIICKGIGKALLNLTAEQSTIPVMTWYYFGGFLGCFVFLFIFSFTKQSNHLAWNVTFACVSMGILCNSFVNQTYVAVIFFSVLLGIGNSVGLINMYYILALIGKKYDDIKYIRYIVILIIICGGVIGVLAGNLINEYHSEILIMITSMLTVCILLLLLLLSPLFSRIYYGKEWVSDSELSDIKDKSIGMFAGYGLSKREEEVLRLLLKGYTLRQIAATISLAYPTINTYCTSIYRKLGINSRTELLLKFKDFTE